VFGAEIRGFLEVDRIQNWPQDPAQKDFKGFKHMKKRYFEAFGGNLH